MTILNLTELKEKATELGIEFPRNITAEVLSERINNNLLKTANKTPVVSKIIDLNTETNIERMNRVRKEATRMIHARIACMNPIKSAQETVVITTSNSITGTIRYDIPLNRDWHIPQMVLDVLKDKQYQTFSTKTIKDKEVKTSHLVPEYAIEILAPLTDKELQALDAIN